MVPVVVTFALFEDGRGAGAVSAALAAQFGPNIILMLVGGVVADKFPRRTVMACANLLRFCSQALLAGLLFTHHAPLGAIMALMACIGVGGAFFAPGLQGLMTELVPAPHLHSANVINSMAISIGRVAGPALGGVLVAVAGGSVAIALDSLVYLVCVVILFTLPATQRPPAQRETMLVLLKEGWAAFFGRKWLWVSALQFAIMNLLVIGPLLVLGPLLFAHQAHGALGWGGLLSLMGVGTIIGSILIIRFRPRYPLRLMTMASVSFALMPGALAAHLPYLWVGACFFVRGMFTPVYMVLFGTLVQTKVPKDKLSRVSAYDYIASFGTLPLGYALAAPLAHVFSISGALWLGAGVVIMSVVAVLLVKEVWMVQAGPDPDPAS